MSSSQFDARAGRVRTRYFATTRWSLVLAARRGPTAESCQALSTLCERYWYPLYAYVRRRGFDAVEAQDLTQEFFARLLEKNYLADADRNRGRFRSFLLASLRHFLANERERRRAKKRGGDRIALSWDWEFGENRYRLEPVDEKTPEKVFEEGWAVVVLEHAGAGLAEEYARRGQSEVFERLKAFLSREGPDVTYRQLARELDSSERMIKFRIHRLRRQFRERVRAEIAQTVSEPGEIEEEIRFLFGALRR